MLIEQILLLIILVAGSALYATRRLPFEVTSILIIVSLALTGILPPEKAFSGFASTATLTVAAMFVLSGGLIRTGALEAVTIYLARFSNGSPRRLLLLLAFVIPVASAFVNDTPVVVMMVPVVISLSRQFQISPSKLLLPVSYFAILGGTLTLLGTSTNIVISDLYRQAGGSGFGVFDFTPLGLIYSVVGGLFIFLFSHRLLPNRSSLTSLVDNLRESPYISEIALAPQSKLIGQRVADVFSRIARDPQAQDVDPLRAKRRRISNLRHLNTTTDAAQSTVELLTVTRDGRTYQGPRGQELTLDEGDILTFLGTPNTIARFLSEAHTRVAAVAGAEVAGNSNARDQTLVEAVILPESLLTGRRLDETQLDELYGVKILGVQHRGRPVLQGLSSRRLESGDVLLLQAAQPALHSASEAGRLLLIEGVERSILHADKNVRALLIMLGVVGMAAFTPIPISVLALTGAVLMIVTRCLRVDEAIHRLESSTLLLLAAALPLGYAMDSTGLAAAIVDFLLHSLGGMAPVIFLSIFYLVTNLLAQILTAKAVAVLFTPIALSLAANMGVRPEPMIMAIAFGCAASFLTPMGHQVNAIVMGPGNYTFGDYIRFGLPMTILMWLVATICIPLLWPL
ncbi:MAG: SLC13 family permease [Caldilineaceae bacterium]|nr:SLC13 family permease [Caldilineaceae bacterium]MCB0140209.1 SLC13 family permease [Caldilineaceae bacterium]